jgi:uncharacterized membrane protein YkgB
MIPFISNSPFTFWLYPVFGLRGGPVLRCVRVDDLRPLYAGFWDKRFGILGALGSTVTFLTTLTIIPFMPNGWNPAAGFPAMAGDMPFLMKDIVLLAVSIYLLKQDGCHFPTGMPKLSSRRPHRQLSSGHPGT